MALVNEEDLPGIIKELSTVSANAIRSIWEHARSARKDNNQAQPVRIQVPLQQPGKVVQMVQMQQQIVPNKRSRDDK